MERLTLGKAWQLCLRQWKWIIKEREKYDNRNKPSVVTLKRKWLKEHGFDSSKILCECFFCEYGNQQKEGTLSEASCGSCPGRLVSRRFNCITYLSYRYSSKPLQFYRKLLALNKKRLAAKAMRREKK